jgi:lysophospholipase L1-like esterase
MNPTRLTALLISLFIVFIFLFRTDAPTVETRKLGARDLVLAFGDSLTYGYGAPDQSYPKQLQPLIQREVINAGIPGELSSTGLQRLPKLLERYHPSLVILCHGGNDILRRMSQERLKANLAAMIRLCREYRAQVLLVDVPAFGMLGLKTLPLYAELSWEEGVLYEGGILAMIENDPVLKSDTIHPNASGYRLMAEAFKNVLKEHGVI